MMKLFTIFPLYCSIVIALLVPSTLNAGIINRGGSIAAKHSGKCMDVSGGSAVDGAVIIQNPCLGNNNQKWVLRPYQDAYRVVVSHSGKCLVVSGASQADGAETIQSSCTGVNNELWYARLQGDYFQLVAKHSDKCLIVLGSSQNSAVKVVQQACTGADNGLWSIASRTHTPIQVRHSNQCMNVLGGSTADAAGVVQSPCQGGNSQQWTLMPYQDAYRIIAKHSGKCLNVFGASLVNGALATQALCAGVNNELWYPRQVGRNYRLIAKHSNKCLAVNAGSQAASAAIIQTSCSGDNSQFWKIDTPSTTGGRWSNPIALSLVPVAAANLPNGKVLLWSSHDRLDLVGTGGKTYTLIYDPATNLATERYVTETGHDMFCPGTANLPDGRILVNGGINSARTSIYNSVTEQWLIGQTMNVGRGYNADTVLSNGDVFTLGGSWSGGLGFKDGESWNPSTGWRRIPSILADAILTNDLQGIYRADNQGWFFGVDNGQVFHAGPSKQMNWFSTTGNGTSTPAGNRGSDAHSMNGNAVMYDIGKIMKTGGAPDYQNSNATTSAYIIDINNGINVRQIPALAYPRAYNSSVVLPNGEVIVFGGQAYPRPFTDWQPALATELWNPATEIFTTLASMNIPRTYHSVALLLPDGRVLAAGGGLCGTCSTNHADAEIFTPPYLLNADGSNAERPRITQAPTNVSYGERITVTTNATISSFALVRLSSVTHSVNNDQRRIPLSFTTAATFNSYLVNIPASRGVAIPGYYMLFAMNRSGAPSRATMIKVG
jgi:galactose oxidase